MSATRMQQTETSLFARPLCWIVGVSIRFPVATLAAGIIAAAVSLLSAWNHLEFHTSRADLLNPRSEYHRRWLAYTQEFGDQEDAVVVVEGPSPAEIVPVLRELAEAIRQEDRLFEDVLHEIDLARLRAKGLYYLDPSQLAALEAYLGEVEPVLQGDWSRFNLGQMATWLSMAASQPEALPAGATDPQALGRLADVLLAALSDAGYQASGPDVLPGLGPGGAEPKRFLSEDGRLGFVLLRFKPDQSGSFARNSEAIDTLRQMAADAERRHAETRVGVTGLPVMENDEMRASDSSTQATILSLVGVAVVFVAGFGGLRYPMVIAGSLMLAVMWSLGYVVVAVGHLNILSSAFGAILIGLGDYGVHYMAQYFDLRQRIASPSKALVETVRTVGPGITTAALTMAGAFFAASLTDFTGVAELGIIAGGGILLCWLADLTVLPALIRLLDREQATLPPASPLDFYIWLKPLATGRWVTLAAMVAVTFVLSLGIARLRYDYNLLNLQPVGLESVELQHKLLNQTKRSAWYALSIARTPEEALARREAFSRLPAVERVEELASLLPSREAEKRPIIQRVHARLEGLPREVPALPVVPRAALDAAAARLEAMLAMHPQAQAERRAWTHLRYRLRELSEAEYCRRVSQYQQAMATDVLTRLEALKAVADPVPPQLTDLPESLVRRFVGRTGRYLLHVYCRGDVWDRPTVERFVRQVRSVDPEATGNPLQIYEASRQMNESYIKAACYALVVIVIVLLFDFRSLSLTLLASLPLGLGMLQLFGLMGYLDIPLNPANTIVLPLILGIGIDTGVHIVHDFHSQGPQYRRISSSTATAVVVNSLTTMVGFGSLMIASHQGLQSLGRVLTLGITCCLLTALVLPNLLVVLAPQARQSGASARPTQPPASPPAEETQTPPEPIPLRRQPPEPAPAAPPHQEPLRPAA